MRQSFWPDRAWDAVVGAAAPWVSVLDAAPTPFTLRLGSTLDPYWASRVQRVPEAMLSSRGKQTMLAARARIGEDSPAGCGFEVVAAAKLGQADALWFFDMGAVAWVLTLGALRLTGRLGVEDGGVPLDEVEAAWRAEGPVGAARLLDAGLASEEVAPVLALYRAPIALWHDRDPARAIALLDQALTELPVSVVAAAGATVPLTYGLAFALQGQVREAAALLDEARITERPEGWRGLDAPEVRYHRARYLWDTGDGDAAIALLRRVLEEAPSFAARALTDLSWADSVQGAAPARLVSAIGDLANRARSALTRWQQTRQTGDEDDPEVQGILDVVQFSGDEPLMLLAVGAMLRSLDGERAAQAAVGPVFWESLDRLREFAATLPSACALRLGDGFAPRFQGPNSDMARLEALVDARRLADAQGRVEALTAIAPAAARVATASYAARMVTSLATAAQVLFERGRAEDEVRYSTTVDLAERCLTLIEPIRALPDTLGADLNAQLQAVWTSMLEIERLWVQGESRAYGQMQILISKSREALPRGEWVAYRVQVVDAAQQPVAGVPLRWRVVSGPATPKDPVDNLEGEWALSMKTGVAYLPVSCTEEGDEGVIEASILGDYSPVAFSYSVSSGAPSEE